MTDFEWETTGLKPGDYTVLFILMNQNEEVVSGTYADLYLSDREIPLEGIDLYVHELETEGSPERIATGLGAQFSVGVRYRPYHTTADRSYTVTSLNDSSRGTFPRALPRGTLGVPVSRRFGGHDPHSRLRQPDRHSHGLCPNL